MKDDWVLQSSYIVKEDGREISSGRFQPKSWYPTTVPTTVLAALVRNGVYPDPYVGLNNMKIPDASDEFNQTYDLRKYSHLPDKSNPWKDPYWFLTHFRLPDDYRGRIIWLNLEGINYRAEIWLNGHNVADSQDIVGMFGNWIFNVTKYADLMESNILAIKIFPLDYPGLPSEPQLKAFGPFGPNGGTTGDIGKNVTMHCSVGWDWIPAVRDRNIGIWQDVYLSASGPVDVHNPHIMTDLPLPSLERAELTIDADVINLIDYPQSGTLMARIRPKNFKGDEWKLDINIDLDPRETKTIRFNRESHEQVWIENPKLWWPNGYGKQHLYELELTFEVDGVRSDIERQTFGIREVDSRITEVDGWTRRDFFVNGKKILIRGGAWVPDMMLNRSVEKLYHELRLSKEANLNMVRIWGGGLTPPAEFFNICDHMGLLVWHDFWITGDCQGTWGKGSQEYPYDADVFLKNASDVVKRLRNHPSLLVWAAGNEGYPREEIYVPLRNEILAELDGTRPFLPSSGYREPPQRWGLSWPDNQKAGTYSGGPYHWVDPKEYYKKVDEQKDWLFKNEVGLPSVPCLESLKKFIPDLEPDLGMKFPLNHMWGYHDACEGNGKYSLYDEAIRKRYGEPKDLLDYVRKAQLINAENYRTIFESINHAMDRVAGVILWKTNPAWPSVIWQLYDWYLCPNAGYYFTKKACEPLHIQLNIDDLSVSVVNHHLQTKDVVFIGHVYSRNMERIWAIKDRIRISASSSAEIVRVEIPEEAKSDVYFVELQLRDDQANLISENFYWLTDGDDYTSLSILPQVKLDVEIDKIDTKEQVMCHFWVKNSSDTLAFFVNPSIRKGEDGEEVLPSFWSDNFFSILPGRTKEITVEFQRSKLEGTKAFLRIEGWNIVSQTILIDL